MTGHRKHKKNAKIFFEPYHHADRIAGVKAAGKGRTVSPESYFESHFARPVIITPNGRTAISLILKSLNLKSDDEVYITTTFEKPNVSSCVTSTIFNFCRPSRVLTDKTKAIFVIHEFGVPHPRTGGLGLLAKKRGIPLIEDCAHSIDSEYKGGVVGRTGDYAICSFTKIFPIKYGGLLIGKSVKYKPTRVQAKIIADIRRLIPKYMYSIAEYSERKRSNYFTFEKKFKKLSLKPLMKLDDHVSPSFFFPLVTDRFEEVLEASARSGIECGLWHGTNIVVLPMHQFLNERELERIFRMVRSVYSKKRNPHYGQ